MNLSYLMGGDEISDADLQELGIEIAGVSEGGNRKLKIPEEALGAYIELVKAKLTAGFWNEIVGETQILFIFKFNDGSIKEIELSPATEQEIDTLCEEFNDQPPREAGFVPNVYNYISENDFYHDFMLKHYAGRINRA